ncbi:hypothetical protein NDU88_004525 [Pleurodeles waltl]|uniref:Uncharacterized protein n=1 Tax=Pleurodeles waltl TaxID=8319 RepID=A0AAV7W969_PLEWA|nr:hypothetical protein NDU88_004525 [Pleurodeles waltl]
MGAVPYADFASNKLRLREVTQSTGAHKQQIRRRIWARGQQQRKLQQAKGTTQYRTPRLTRLRTADAVVVDRAAQPKLKEGAATRGIPQVWQCRVRGSLPGSDRLHWIGTKQDIAAIQSLATFVESLRRHEAPASPSVRMYRADSGSTKALQ